uniref:Uncharacterized protein n=1 Tax=Avena sativa TaxID=4498 RepID=A0ACD5UFV6_AVESA
MGYLSTVIGHPTDGSPVSGGGLRCDRFPETLFFSSSARAFALFVSDLLELLQWRFDSLLLPCNLAYVSSHIARNSHKPTVRVSLAKRPIGHGSVRSETALDDSYKSTDNDFLESDSTQNQCGSTASTAVLVGNRLFVANVGDSRAIICRGGDAVPVSKDHKPDQTDERQRIEEAGGFVMWAGTWRVGGVLAVSRAFGDKLLKQYVVVDPEIREEIVDDSLEFLILASDGLWDVVSNEEAVDMTRSIQDPEEAAKRLLQEAYVRESSDNITCVVVRFFHGQGSSGPA